MEFERRGLLDALMQTEAGSRKHLHQSFLKM
jgi:hypothetical protein